MKWEPYLGDRLILREEGFVVIKPVDAGPSVPLCCPLCDTMMRNRDDEEAYWDFTCCHLCALAWAHARREKWKEGWRPSQGEIIEVVKNRGPLKMAIIMD